MKKNWHFFILKKKCLVGVQENKEGVKAILTKSKCEQIFFGMASLCEAALIVIVEIKL